MSVSVRPGCGQVAVATGIFLVSKWDGIPLQGRDGGGRRGEFCFSEKMREMCENKDLM